ncbi:pilin outer membrane usher protein SafC, partial [Enterobacter cloacae]|uniref:fimbria/pilus outer membrane usher protein n=1 Tax=Enterobacter sp. 148H3 TaxID=3077756 RepID=UPI000DCCB1BA
PNAEVKFDFYNQQLFINIPQIYIKTSFGNMVDKALWNEGVTAALLNYSYSFSRNVSSINDSSQYDSSFLQIKPGVNIGSWRFRNTSSWVKTGNDRFFQRGSSYAEKGLNNINSRLLLGELNSPPEIFPSFPFTGVYVGSDEFMIPGSQKNYTPAIKGTAKTNARIEVSQNGNVIYKTNVPAGAFSLEDIPSSYGGELIVTVFESDGQKQILNIPFSSPAISIREGYYSYQFIAGKYGIVRSSSEDMRFSQANLTYGLPYSLTALGGVQIADTYNSIALGAGKSFGLLGALSYDSIYTHASKDNAGKQNGLSKRLRYNKFIESTGSNFSIDVQKFTDGFSDFSSHVASYDSFSDMVKVGNAKRLSIFSLGQSLGQYGALSVYFTKKTAFSNKYDQESLGTSYNFMIGSVSAMITYNDNVSSRTGTGKLHDRISSLWVSIPFGRTYAGGANTASYQYVSPSSGSPKHELAINGHSFDQQLDWSLRQSRTQDIDSRIHDSTFNASWYGPRGNVGGIYSFNKNNKQYGIDASGGLLIHADGITFSQPFGDTISLVEAKGASGVKLIGMPGLKTDSKGYAVQSNLRAYNENLISLDPEGLSDNAEILQTDEKVIPTKGAVVNAKFKTRIGNRVLLKLMSSKGRSIPFGAIASFDGESSGAGVVDENGVVYLTGVPNKGKIIVKWGGDLSKQCDVIFDLSNAKTDSGLIKINSDCN